MVRITKGQAKKIGRMVGKSMAQRSGPLSAKQKEAFKKAKRNYNARITRQVKKWTSKYPDMTAEDVMRSGIVPWKMTKRVDEIKTTAEYKTLMQLMRHQKTKTFKKQTLKETRNTLKQVLDYAYFPDPTTKKEMFGIIDRMTAEEIMDFRLSNKTIVKNFFLAYDFVYNGEGDEPLESREDGLANVMEALRQYKKVKS